MAWMRAVRFTPKSVPVVFALIAVVAYGLLLPRTGFYWDDWPFAWIARFLGPTEFLPAFRGFRPFLGPIFFLTTSLLPANPLLWQALAVLIRFISVLAARFALGQVWPRAARLILIVSLLFLVFPGYSQHWVAFTHINQEWISLIAYLLSFGISIRALRDPRPSRALIALSLALQCIGLLPTEYFIGMELLRPLLFWIVLSESLDAFRVRLHATLRACLPYLLVWLINATWLAYYYKSGAYISYEVVAAAFATTPLDILRAFGDAIWKTGLYVWIQVLPLVSGSLAAPSSLATIAIIAIAFPLLAFYLLRFDARLDSASPVPAEGGSATGNGDRSAQRIIARWAVLAGIAGMLLGRVPSFVTGLPLTLQSSFDRLTISMMLGAGLFVAGALELLVPNQRLRTLLFAGLVALGMGQQVFNANIFRRDWENQQRIYWQMFWRIPGLAPHTAILAQQLPLDYETDLAMTAVVNWMYAPNPKPPDLPYAFIFTEKRLGGDALPGLRAGIPIRLPFRTMEFNGSTSDVIAVYVPPNGCLRVFDPEMGDAETYSRFPEALTAAIPLSDLSRILVQTSSHDLPNPPFGPEPAHGWCYFYEKAELARQGREWGQIVTLRQQAAEQGVEAQDPFEWLPFIEAEGLVGDTGWATEMTYKALDLEPKLQRGLCALWMRLSSTGASRASALSTHVRSVMACDQ